MTPLLALDPFSTGDTTNWGASSEVTHYDVSWVDRADLPTRTWRTSSKTAAGTYEFSRGGTASLDGVYVDRTNYPAVKIHAGSAYGTYTEITPNLLLHSDNLQATSWSQISGGTVTTQSAIGPKGVGENGGWVLSGSSSGDGISQAVDVGAGAATDVTVDTNVVFSAWLKPGVTVTMSVASGLSTSTLDVAPDNTQYQRQSIGMKMPAAGQTLEVQLTCTDGGGLIDVWRPQLTLFAGSTTTPLDTDYETNEDGLVIPLNGWAPNRRQAYFELPPADLKFFKWEIPGNQDTDLNSAGNSVTYYETGTLKVVDTAYEPAYIVPSNPMEIDKPHREVTYESGSIRRSRLGPNKMATTVSTPWLAESHSTLLQALASAEPGAPVLYVERKRCPNAIANSLYDNGQAYVMEVDGTLSFRYTVPELVDFELNLTEIT